MKELLLEIGVEEVPARFLPMAATELERIGAEHLRTGNINFGSVHAYVTPRRLVFFAEDVAERQQDVVKEVFGPPKKAAYDEKGNPTKAAIGFARSVGVSPDQLQLREKNSGEYVMALIEEKGRPVREVLPDVLKKIILSLHFPKSMRWGDGNLRFVRPIRWILSMFDFEIIELDIDGIKSSNLTKGHRFLSPVAFQIKDARNYKRILETSFVVIDQDKRRQVIQDELRKLAASVHGTEVSDQELLQTVTHLVEYPVGVLCEFSRDYLELPEELLITVMKDHQKYFAMRELSSGRLLNYFIVISNTLKENSFIVRTGAERVIKARFEDARFYYQDDLKKSLESRIEGLKKVVFHEKLGTLHDKSLRLKEIISEIETIPEVREKAAKAAMLAKTDLLSGVVREFPELQGIMGKYYATHEGLDPQVAQAILEQYLPRYAGDALPESQIGTDLSLADRIDNIVSFFSIGLKPTGSEDPFALRRQAIGICQILLEKECGFSIEKIFLAGLRAARRENDEKLAADIQDFVISRLPQILQGRGYEADSIDSVLGLAIKEPLQGIVERLNALQKFRRQAGFNLYLAAIKRVRNILPAQRTDISVDEGLFREKEEKELYREFLRVKAKVDPLLLQMEFGKAILALTEITGPVNAFFERVLVMDKDPKIRENRLGLLAKIWSLSLRVCDFSSLSEV